MAPRIERGVALSRDPKAGARGGHPSSGNVGAIRPVRHEVVAHVLGTICHPCLRVGHPGRKWKGGSGRALPPSPQLCRIYISLPRVAPGNRGLIWGDLGPAISHLLALVSARFHGLCRHIVDARTPGGGISGLLYLHGSGLRATRASSTSTSKRRA